MYKNNKKMCFGVIIGTRAYFNSELARDVRAQLLKTLEEQGYDHVILPEDATPTGSSIETREDGLKCSNFSASTEMKSTVSLFLSLTSASKSVSSMP